VFLKNELDVHAHLSFERGCVREHLAVTPKTLWAFCRLGAALLTDQGREYNSKLQSCPVCGRFAIRWETRRGAPRRFCSPACKNEATRQHAAQRQKAFRARHFKRYRERSTRV
jgi:hypothetical protein